MATFGTVDIDVKIRGDGLPLLRAFGIMSAALAAYGHEFSDEEMTTIAEAAELLCQVTGERPALDFDVDANLEPSA